MTAPDPTTGVKYEADPRDCCDRCGGAKRHRPPCTPASPPAVAASTGTDAYRVSLDLATGDITTTPANLPAASTGTSEDVETPNIVQRIVNAWDCCGTCAGGVLARHMADREAAARAEERERIAQAIEARKATFVLGGALDACACRVLDLAARIAREGR